ncbi:hypothetical protein IAT38_004238 [Cryptococcus sp. DSM 104549]
MNSYFRQDGERAWSSHERISPTYQHVLDGAHTIHEKCWQGWVDHRLPQLYHERLGRMEAYWMAKGASKAAVADSNT